MYCDQASINEEYQVLVNLYKAHCSQSDAGSQVLEVLSFLLKSESCCLKIESNEATPIYRSTHPSKTLRMDCTIMCNRMGYICIQPWKN